MKIKDKLLESFGGVSDKWDDLMNLYVVKYNIPNIRFNDKEINNKINELKWFIIDKIIEKQDSEVQDG